MDGLLVLNKPVGPTSHDVVARVRRSLREQRIGHTGTLDPQAAGVLPLVIGRATRLARFLTAGDKVYEAVIRLGVSTDTYDAEGHASERSAVPLPGAAAIEEALESFRGTFLQRPPVFSAKKIGGRRSHEMARAGEVREPLEPVTVSVRALDLITVDGDLATLRIECSAGFYVRSLAHDLGQRLGVGAHLATLTRTRSGEATLDGALPLDVVEREPARAAASIVPMSRMLTALSAVVLTPEGVRHATFGRNLGPADFAHPSMGAGAWLRLVDPAGDLVGIAEPTAAPGVLHPSVVLL